MIRIGGAVCAVLGLPASAAVAQAPDRSLPGIEYQADRHGAAERDGAYGYGLAATPARPWALAAWLPANWSSNLGATESDLTRGIVLEPELTLARTWGTGPVTLFTEVGGFISTALPDAQLDVSGWWLTLELSGGDPAVQLAPYFSYEPLGLYETAFGSHILTFHNFTLGVRRTWSATSLTAFVSRRESNIAIAARNTLGAQLSRDVPVSGNLGLNLRVDAEFRPYDREDGIRRQDFRTRARGRLVMPLDPAVDLALTADIQRNWSSADGFSYTNVIVGPALSASFGF